MKIARYIALILAVCAVAFADAQPRFVVNIVVSGLRQGDIHRYQKNFGKDGFLRLRSEGVEFTECYADYAPTTSEAGLATLATGTAPATHGIFSSVLFDRTSNKEVALCHKPLPEQSGLVRKEVEERFTTQHFSTQTLSEAVLSSSERN